MAVDTIDRKICGIVQGDANQTIAQIAHEVGLSVSSTGERLKRLHANGTITRVEAKLDPSSFERKLLAFVHVDMSYEGEADAVEALVGLTEVQEVHHVSGPHSYLLKVRVKDTDHLESLMSTKIKPLQGVCRSETIVALKSHKETGQLDLSQ